MATPKGSIALNADFSRLASVEGALRGMVETIKTDRFLTPLVEYTHADLANEFDKHMDTLAPMAHARFHHVYEWDQEGVPSARLWKHQLKGRGSSNRFASWAWRSSKMPIRTPEERAENPNDPMSDLSDDKVASFNTRQYVFIWKAPVMEYNTQVTITPKYSDQIAFPSSVKPGKIIGRDEVIVENPGGAATTLAFTSEWTKWWNTQAPAIFKETLEKEIKKGTENATIAAVKRGSRSATVGVHNMSYAAAEAQGRRWAAENLHKFANSKATEADWYEPESDV